MHLTLKLISIFLFSAHVTNASDVQWINNFDGNHDDTPWVVQRCGDQGPVIPNSTDCISLVSFEGFFCGCPQSISITKTCQDSPHICLQLDNNQTFSSPFTLPETKIFIFRDMENNDNMILFDISKGKFNNKYEFFKEFVKFFGFEQDQDRELTLRSVSTDLSSFITSIHANLTVSRYLTRERNCPEYYAVYYTYDDETRHIIYRLTNGMENWYSSFLPLKDIEESNQEKFRKVMFDNGISITVNEDNLMDGYEHFHILDKVLSNQLPA